MTAKYKVGSRIGSWNQKSILGNELYDFIGINYYKKINIKRWVKVITSVLFFKITLRYNLYTKNSTTYNSSIFSIFKELCNNHKNLILGHFQCFSVQNIFSHPKKKTCIHQQSFLIPSHHHSFPISANTIYFLSLSVPIVNLSPV